MFNEEVFSFCSPFLTLFGKDLLSHIQGPSLHSFGLCWLARERVNLSLGMGQMGESNELLQACYGLVSFSNLGNELPVPWRLMVKQVQNWNRKKMMQDIASESTSSAKIKNWHISKEILLQLADPSLSNNCSCYR